MFLIQTNGNYRSKFPHIRQPCSFKKKKNVGYKNRCLAGFSQWVPTSISGQSGRDWWWKTWNWGQLPCRHHSIKSSNLFIATMDARDISQKPASYHKLGPQQTMHIWPGTTVDSYNLNALVICYRNQKHGLFRLLITICYDFTTRVLRRFPTACGAHPAYSLARGGCFCGNKADHQCPFSAEVKNGGAMLPTPPPSIHLHGRVLGISFICRIHISLVVKFLLCNLFHCLNRTISWNIYERAYSS
jgi:hypothetical protein